MDYYGVEKSLQVLFERHIPLSRSQLRRLGDLCAGVLLAESPNLTKVARRLKRSGKQDSRVRWIKRLLGAKWMRQEHVYEPLVRQALNGHHARQFHVVMDRTDIVDHQTDLLSVTLNFRKRSIPLVWQFMPVGMSGYDRQAPLVKRAHRLLPKGIPVIFHGDNEFGGVQLMKLIRRLGWDFIVGQSKKNYYRPCSNGKADVLENLPVTKSKAVYLSHIELTKTHWYGPLNLFAFYKPAYSRRRRKRDVRYCATSLPIAPTIRRVGRRRWGIECCFKDFKSSGWDIEKTCLTAQNRQEGLMTVLSIAYLWATCLGRWLCKTSRRSQVDSRPKRNLSLFRIGWDWLVYQYRNDLPCPTLLTLYQ